MLEGKDAPTFFLQNQFGQPTSLADHHGKVVVLTFLYTSCPDVCPIVTSQLRDTYEILGSSSAQVALVAISVDPLRDTVEAAYAFSQKWEMTDRWDFLVGQEEELSPIWGAYYLQPIANYGLRQESEDGADQHSDGAITSSALAHVIDESYPVAHTTPVFLIDREGELRVVFTPPLDIEAVAHDIRLLLK